MQVRVSAAAHAVIMSTIDLFVETGQSSGVPESGLPMPDGTLMSDGHGPISQPIVVGSTEWSTAE